MSHACHMHVTCRVTCMSHVVSHACHMSHAYPMQALKLSNKARQTSTVGEIVNLMSVDAQRFMDTVTYIHMMWSAPLQIILSLIFLYLTMGPSIFAGFGVMLIMIPVNGVLASQARKFQVRQMKQKDVRIKLVNEVLNGIKVRSDMYMQVACCRSCGRCGLQVIKLYAWEFPFKKLIKGIRHSELNIVKKAAYLMSFMMFSWTCAPFIVSHMLSTCCMPLCCSHVACRSHVLHRFPL